MHVPCAETPDGMYVLAAAVADPGACEPVRDVLRDLVPRRGQGRLHWREEKEPGRRKIVEAIAAAPHVSSLVVIGTPLEARGQERARRKCLERLLWELLEQQVSRVWVESRGNVSDRRDLALLAGWRSQVVAARSRAAQLRMDFARPLEEPMLWVPDAVAGAVAESRKGDPSHRIVLGDLVLELPIEV